MAGLSLHILLILVLLSSWRGSLPPTEDGDQARGLIVGLATSSRSVDAAAQPKPATEIASAVAAAPPRLDARQDQAANPPIVPRPGLPRATDAFVVDPTAEPVALDGSDPSPRADVASEAEPRDSGSGCRLTEDLTSALQNDATVIEGASHIPADARSVANAVMLWDGHWTPATALGGAEAFDPLWTNVTRTIDAATPACRRQPLRGPRLIILRTPSEALVLVFGSGVWRWSDVLER